MNFIISILASLAAAFLFDKIPPRWKQRGLDRIVGDCFDRARNQWNEAVASRYEYKGEQLRSDLLAFIKGEKPEDPELEELLTNWVAQMKDEPACQGYIMDAKIDSLGERISGISESVISGVTERLQALGIDLDAIDNKLDEIIVLERSNKEDLVKLRGRVESLVSPTQLVCLNDLIDAGAMLPGSEVRADSLKDDSLWVDKACMNAALAGLSEDDNQPFFVIMASEGRGKSILSCQVAYEMIRSDHYTVYITRKSWTWNQVSMELDMLLSDDKPIMIVLENIHSESNGISLILNYARIHKGNGGGKHLFLMNTRHPDMNEGGSEINSLNSDQIIDLDDYQLLRAKSIAGFMADKSGLKIDKLTVNKEALISNIPPNLRVLSKYFQVYNFDHVADIDETSVLHLFTENYGLSEPSGSMHYSVTERNKCLMKLGALNLFDVPLDKEALSDKEIDILISEMFSKKLFYGLGGRFFMPHSTDAMFLCLALCGRDLRKGQALDQTYQKQVEDTVKAYFQVLIDKHKAGDLSEEIFGEISRDFKSFIESTRSSNDFFGLNDYYRDPGIAPDIIRYICPGFVLAAVTNDPGENDAVRAARYAVYQGSIDVIKTNLSQFRFSQLSSLYRVISHYDGYKGDRFAHEVFDDLEENTIREWLLSHDSIWNDRLLTRFKHLPICASALNSVKKIRPGFIKYRNRKLRSLVSNAMSELRMLVGYLDVGNVTIDDVQDRIESLISKVKEDLKTSFRLNDSFPLSYIFQFLGYLDREYSTCFKQQLIDDEVVLNDAQKRLGYFDYSKAEFYYFSHFFNDSYPELRDGIRKYITCYKNPGNIKRMMAWLCFVRNVYLYDTSKIKNKPFAEGTLAFEVEQVVRKEVDLCISKFNYSYSELYFLAGFYNDAYPEIKNRIDDLISVPDKWERIRMGNWIDKVKMSLARKGRKYHFQEGTLEYAVEKALNHQ